MFISMYIVRKLLLKLVVQLVSWLVKFSYLVPKLVSLVPFIIRHLILKVLILHTNIN